MPSLSISPATHTHTRHTYTHRHAHACTLYPLSKTRILNHVSVSHPSSFICNINSHTRVCSAARGSLARSLALALPPLFLYLSLSADSPAHLVTVRVKYECARSSVLVWSAAPTMSFVSGLNRRLSTHSEALAPGPPTLQPLHPLLDVTMRLLFFFPLFSFFVFTPFPSRWHPARC